MTRVNELAFDIYFESNHSDEFIRSAIENHINGFRKRRYIKNGNISIMMKNGEIDDNSINNLQTTSFFLEVNADFDISSEPNLKEYITQSRNLYNLLSSIGFVRVVGGDYVFSKIEENR